jgi:hypothetical protein
MRRLVFLALLVAHRSPEPDPVPSCKPTAPIDLEARLEGDPTTSFSVSARASSRLGLPVELEVVLPEGVAHHAGARKVSGVSCETRLDASVPDRTRREIFVRATVSEGTAKLTKVIPLVLFDKVRPAAATLRKNSRGEALLEYSP